MSQSATAPRGTAAPIHQKSIFFASFMTLIVAGVGFGVRGGILGDWGAQFGFTKSELGQIAGAGLSGFGFTIIFFSFFADTFGYKFLLSLAFVLHLLSAVITLAGGVVYSHYGAHAAYWTLYIGTFIFALANGLCEAAINPLTATLFPTNKTHYLNILHAGWPGGLVLGGFISYLFAGKSAAVRQLPWELLTAIYLLPVFYYGAVVLRNRFPVSEAKAAGLKMGQMILHVFAPLLLFLFLIHAMIGYVELGTDGWVQNILNNTIGNKASLLFVYTSLLMFVLRFCAGPIVHKINPLGLLFIAACCGAGGLYMLGTMTMTVAVFAAATIFALGKTFYWPTMLGVIGERFPKAGAIAMGLSGGIGCLSAGFLGGPGIGYTQDYHASTSLQATAPGAYDRVKSENKDHFYFCPEIQGLNAKKTDVILDKDAKGASAPAATLKDDLSKKPDDKDLKALYSWYSTVEEPHVKQDVQPVGDAVIFGGRRALQITALVPVGMAACYLLLVIFFAATGGYKPLHLESSGQEVAGPVEGI